MACRYSQGDCGNEKNSVVRKYSSSKADEQMKNNLLDGLFDETDQRFVNSHPVISNEIKGYEANASMKDCHSVLEFWKLCAMFYPMLSMVARLAFTPAETGTESELVFSVVATFGDSAIHRHSSLTWTNTEILVVTNKYLSRMYDLS